MIIIMGLIHNIFSSGSPERNPDEEDADFHDIFQINDLATPDPDNQEDECTIDLGITAGSVSSSSSQQDDVPAVHQKCIQSLPSDHNLSECCLSDAPGYLRTTDRMSAIIWNNKGVVLSRLERFSDAVEAFDQALMIDPRYCAAWNNKGVLLSRMGEYTKALEAFEKALQPDWGDSVQNRIPGLISPKIVSQA